jgi:hypothetical protein
MKIFNLHILTTSQLLKYGYEQMVKQAHDCYWQGREDEMNNIDSPYFLPNTYQFGQADKWYLSRLHNIPKVFIDGFKED